MSGLLQVPTPPYLLGRACGGVSGLSQAPTPPYLLGRARPPYLLGRASGNSERPLAGPYSLQPPRLPSLLPLTLARVQPTGLLQQAGSEPGFFLMFHEASVGSRRPWVRVPTAPGRHLPPPRSCLFANPPSASHFSTRVVSRKMPHLPRETFLPFSQVSVQHRLQLFLQDAEGLLGGQAQGQGGVALQGSRQGSASPWGPVSLQAGLIPCTSPGPSSPAFSLLSSPRDSYIQVKIFKCTAPYSLKTN